MNSNSQNAGTTKHLSESKTQMSGSIGTDSKEGFASNNFDHRLQQVFIDKPQPSQSNANITQGWNIEKSQSPIISNGSQNNIQSRHDLSKQFGFYQPHQRFDDKSIQAFYNSKEWQQVPIKSAQQSGLNVQQPRALTALLMPSKSSNIKNSRGSLNLNNPSKTPETTQYMQNIPTGEDSSQFQRTQQAQKSKQNYVHFRNNSTSGNTPSANTWQRPISSNTIGNKNQQILISNNQLQSDFTQSQSQAINQILNSAAHHTPNTQFSRFQHKEGGHPSFIPQLNTSSKDGLPSPMWQNEKHTTQQFFNLQQVKMNNQQPRNKAKSTYALYPFQERDSKSPRNNRADRKRSQDERFQRYPQELIDNQSSQVLNMANTSQTSFQYVPNMTFSISGQKVAFQQKMQQKKIQRPTTAQIEKVNKLGEIQNDKQEQEIGKKIEEYQKIIQNAELDISKQDHIKRGEGIEEWKASYVSNQSMSEMNKARLNQQEIQSQPNIQSQHSRFKQKRKTGGKQRTITSSILEDNMRETGQSSPITTTVTNINQQFDYSDFQSSQNRGKHSSMARLSKQMDKQQIQVRKNYGLQATYKPHHNRIASAGVQGSKLGHKQKRNTQMNQTAHQQSQDHPLNIDTNVKIVQYQSNIKSDQLSKKSTLKASIITPNVEKESPDDQNILKNLLNSDYHSNDHGQKINRDKNSKEYLSFDRDHPIMSTDMIDKNRSPQTAFGNRGRKLVQKNPSYPYATRFSSNKILINLGTNAQPDVVSGRKNTLNYPKDSIRRTEDQVATEAIEKTSTCQPAPEYAVSQEFPETGRSFPNQKGPLMPAPIRASIITSTNFNSPDNTLNIQDFNMNSSINKSKQSYNLMKSQDISNIEQMEQMNITLLKQLKQENKLKIQRQKYQGQQNLNLGIKSKKARMNQYQKNYNNKNVKSKAAGNSNRMKTTSYRVSTQQNPQNMGETAVSHSIVPSDVNSAYISLEQKTRVYNNNDTRIIFQKQQNQLQQQEDIQMHLEMFQIRNQQYDEGLDLDSKLEIVDDMVKMRLNSQIERVQFLNQQKNQLLRSATQLNQQALQQRAVNGGKLHKLSETMKSSRNSVQQGKKTLFNLFNLKDQSNLDQQLLQKEDSQSLNMRKSSQKMQYALMSDKQMKEQDLEEQEIQNNENRFIDYSRHFQVVETKQFDPQDDIDKIQRPSTAQQRALKEKIREQKIVSVKDSIIKEARPEKFDSVIHGKPPASKDKLRYSKFNLYENEIREEHQNNLGDDFKRIGIISNQMRQIYRAPNKKKDKIEAESILPRPSPEKMRKAKIQMLGNFNINKEEFNQMAKYFDPFRLKIIMMSKKEANPFGKNPDFFFVKGIDYINIRDFESAIKNFEKGCTDNPNHFLCRFNLGYTLFSLGGFEQAAQQYKTLWSQCENGGHSEARFPMVLYNKSVSELQSGDFTSAAKSAERCVEILKELEKKKGGSILNLTQMEKDMILDMLQLEGYAHFRDEPGKADAKATGKCFESADVRMGVIEQAQIDKLNLNQEQAALPQGSHRTFMSKGHIKQTVGSQSNLNLVTMGSKTNLNMIPESTDNIPDQIFNKQSVPTINLKGQTDTQNTIIQNDLQAIQNINDNSGRNQQISLDIKAQTFLADHIRHNSLQQGTDSPDTRSVASKNRQSRSSFSIARKSTLQRRRKKNRSLSIIKSQPFHIEADKANDALNMNKVAIDDKPLKSSYNIKKQADRLYGQISWFMDDFMERLDASVLAGHQGGDELNAFKKGFKKDGEEVGSDEEKKKEEVIKATNRTKMTNRNTQRNKNKNQLEMEVEKDLTNLGKLLYKKKEAKKLADKENQQFMLADKKRLIDIFQQLDFKKEMSMSMGTQPKDFFYDKDLIMELDDIITKFKSFRTQIEDSKRQFWLQSGHVRYQNLKRGDILYEQDEDAADCQYWILSGSVSIIRTYIDHELLFKIQNENRVNKAKEGAHVTYSSEVTQRHVCVDGEFYEDSDNLRVSKQKNDILSNTSSEYNKIVEISEHSSDNRSLSGESVTSKDIQNRFQIKKQAMSLLITPRNEDQTEEKHKYQEFLYNLDNITPEDIAASKVVTRSVSLTDLPTTRFGGNGRPSAYNYIPIDMRPENQFDDQENIPFRKQLSLDRKSMACYRAVIKGLGKEKVYGVQLDKSNLEKYNQQFPRIRVAERNYNKGQMFGYQIFDWWKSLKFNQRMIDKIENTITDRIALIKYVKQFHIDKNRRMQIEQEKYLESLSPVRRATLLKQFSESCQDLITDKQSVADSPEFGRSNTRHLFGDISPSQNSNRKSLSSFQGSPSMKKKHSLIKRDSDKQLLSKRKSSIGGSPALQTPELKQQTSSERRLVHQDTDQMQKQIDGYDAQQDKLAVTKKKVQDKIDKLKRGEIENLDDGPRVPPFSLKRENTCLVIENDTLVIMLPYTMDWHYEQHLEKLEQEQRDM